MSTITDKAMQANATGADQWLTESFGRGAGALLGRITPSGSRTFYFRYSGTQGQVRLPVGPFHPKGNGAATFTVGQARAQAMAWVVLRRDQKITDLRKFLEQAQADRQQAADTERKRLAAEQRQRESDANAAELERQQRRTVRQTFDQWRATELQPIVRADGKRVGRKDGGQYVFEQFTRHVFPAIGNQPLDHIRKPDLLALLDLQIAAGKARTANVLLADLKQMLDFALERELIAINPLATTKKAKVGGADVARDRVLSEEEIKQLVQGLPDASMNSRSACAIWLTLATGVRVGELMGAVWADTLPADPKARKARLDALQAQADAEDVKLGMVDLVAGSWYLPTTKNQRDHTIHLSGFAMDEFEKLRTLRELSGKPGERSLSPWVFPATDNTRPVCIKSFGKQLADRQRQPGQRLNNRSKATTALMLSGGRWTAHDLRRTAATLMARLGVSTDTINEALNHITADRMTRVYIHDRREVDQARAFDALGAKLASLLSGSATASNVIVMDKARVA